MMMMMMMLNLVYKGLGNSLTLGGSALLRRQPDLHHRHTHCHKPHIYDDDDDFILVYRV